MGLTVLRPGGTSSSTVSTIVGAQAGDATLEFHADAGDDNADMWRIRVQDGGLATLETFASGAWVAALQLTTSGEITKPLQPAFQVRKSGAQSNIATGSAITITWDTEVVDRGGDFATNTFTAPVDGLYVLSASIDLASIDTAASTYALRMTTSNRNYTEEFDPAQFVADVSRFALTITCLADMDSNDTAIVTLQQTGGAAQTDVQVNSWFVGYLAA